MNQPTAEVRIAACTAQRHTLQQPQGAGSRQPAVLADPAVDAEQRQRQTPRVQADGDQMGERALRRGAPEQVQMAVFAIAAMAVVVALCAATRIHQVTRGIVEMLHRPVAGGEGAHQGPLVINQAQPVMESLLR